MRLLNFPGKKSQSRGVPSHLSQLDQLMRFLGAKEGPQAIMFPRLWPSISGKLGQAICGVYFLFDALLNGKGKLLIRSHGANLLQGEAILTDKNIRGNALRCAFSLKPFLIASTNEIDPIARSCTLLGIDPTEELKVHLVFSALIVFFANRDGRPVVVHLATSPDRNEALECHRRGLEIANAASLPAEVRHLIPELISFSSVENYSLLSQSRLPGKQEKFPADDKDLYDLIHRSLKPLFDFRSTAVEYSEGADYALIFEEFPMLAERWPETRQIVEPLLARLQAWQRERRLVPIMTHGDYWIRNILFDKPGGEVTGIVDWDRARAHGTPGLDALHLVLSSLIERAGGGVMADYLGQVWTGQRESGLLADCIAQIQQVYLLNTDDVHNLGIFLCLDELHRLHLNRGVLSAQRLEKLRTLLPAIDTWRTTTAVSSALVASDPLSVTR